MTRKLFAYATLVLAAMTVGMSSPVLSAGAGKARSGSILGSFWALPKEGAIAMVLAGHPKPITTAITDATILGGICLNCRGKMEFTMREARMHCFVCDCTVINAGCIVANERKYVKEGSWQATIEALPRGVGLHPTFNTPDKPESGLKKLIVDRRSVLLPISGLDGKTPDQILALVEPLGAIKAKMIDGGKRLWLQLNSDWTTEREGTLEKALAKINAKVVVFEEPKPAR
jgi:hypothetical protein